MLKRSILILSLLFTFSAMFAVTSSDNKEQPKIELARLYDYYNNYGYVLDDKGQALYSNMAKIFGEKAGTLQALTVPKVSEELIAIVGEIVLEKATTQAFYLIKKEIVNFLKNFNPGAKASDKLCFSRTIDALRNVRLEEIIKSSDIVYAPLIEDITQYILDNITTPLNKFDKDFLNSIVQNVIIRQIKYSAKPIDSTLIEIINQSFIHYYMKNLENIIVSNETELRKACVSIAAFAVWKTSSKLKNDENSTTIKFELDKIWNSINWTNMDQIAPHDQFYLDVLKIAIKMNNSAKSLTSKTIKISLHNSCDAFFDALFFIYRIDEKNILWRIRNIIDAAIDKDVNVIFREIYSSLGTDVASKGRGLQFLGATLLYAQTYTDPKFKDQQNAHDERARILRTLVTDRKAQQGGNLIFSFGGSLRGILNKKMSEPKASELEQLAGPLSVPIGIGADWYWKKWGGTGGAHFEFGIFDLGQYASFTNGKGEISDPSLTDIFSPSMTISVFVNSTNPIYLGGVFGYCPKYYQDASGNIKKGFFQLGVTIGIYVPLFDF